MPVNTPCTLTQALRAEAAAAPRRARRGRPRARASRAAAGASASALTPSGPSSGRPSPPIRRGARNSASASTRPARSSAGRELGTALDEQRGDLARAEGDERLLERGGLERLDAGGRRRRARAGRRARPAPLAAVCASLAVRRQAAAAVEDDAQRQALGRQARASRGSSSGSSASAVPLPIADRVELRPPVVHERAALGRRDPAALAAARRDAAVERRGQLEQHERAPPHDVHAEGRVLAARPRLVAPAGELDLRPRPPAGARARGRRPRGWDRRWRTRRARCPPRSARRRRAAGARDGCTARARRRPWRRRPARVQASSALRSACGSPRRSCQPSPSTRPSRAITQPTSGFGLALRRPRSARSSARSSSSASRCVHASGDEPRPASARPRPGDGWS